MSSLFSRHLNAEELCYTHHRFLLFLVEKLSRLSQRQGESEKTQRRLSQRPPIDQLRAPAAFHRRPHDETEDTGSSAACTRKRLHKTVPNSTANSAPRKTRSDRPPHRAHPFDYTSLVVWHSRRNSRISTRSELLNACSRPVVHLAMPSKTNISSAQPCVADCSPACGLTLRLLHVLGSAP